MSPLHKFCGEAPTGTSYLLFFEGDTYLGGTSVNQEGRWLWRRVVSWPGGEHFLRVVGITDSGVTAAARRALHRPRPCRTAGGAGSA